MSLCINPQCKQPNNSDTIIFCQGCGSELLLDGRYRVTRELGQGGFGTTYEVIDFHSRIWVLKVLMDNHPKYVELFQQEAQVLKTLKHPGIPTVDLDGYFTYFATEQEEPLHCLVMEKIEGLNLTQYIKQRGYRPIKPKRALRWLAELSLILEQVHQHNFFHRDIKPGNIMLRPNGCLALIDFGSAREVTNSYLQKKELGEVTGVMSQGYTPIEQMKGKAVLQSDFYALGGTAIYLLTAQNPGSFYDVVQDRFDWSGSVKDISPQFVDLIDYMMAFSPTQRPRSSKEIFHRAIAIDSSLKILAEDLADFTHINTSTVSTINQSDTSEIAATQVLNSISSPKPIATNNNNTSNVINSSNSQVDPQFTEHCRRELAEFIGPMANVVCNRAVKENSSLSKVDFCLTLAKYISDPAKAQNFQQRVQKFI